MRKVQYFIAIYIACIVGCAQSPDRVMHSILSGTEIVSDTFHVDMTKSAFRISYSKWTGKQTLYYYISYPPVIRNGKTVTDYFTPDDKKYIGKNTIMAASEWIPHIGMTVKETDDPNKADFTIVWKFLENDGIGGDLALADFPPSREQKYKSRIVMDMADMWKAVKDRNKSKHPYYNVILHEFGHILAGLRHDDSHGIMNTAFNYNSLQIDDAIGARINYRNYNKFDWGDNTYVFIRYGYRGNITTNFKEYEFLSKCSYITPEGHFLALEAINAIQYIRAYYGTPVKILSTFRDISCNRSAGGATYSQHLFRSAIDWKFVGAGARDAQEQYENDINNKKIPLSTLLFLGVRGFGSYPIGYGTNHIDVRGGKLWNRWFGNVGYMVWGEFAKKGQWYDIKAEYRNND